MKISKEDASELMYGHAPEGFTSVEGADAVLFDTSRWGNWYYTIIEKDGKFFRLEYEEGSGDSDYTSYDTDWGDEVELDEVEKHEVTTTEWRKKNKDV